jgi:predicted RNase H-like nuclease (RuvC/YqgF family)
MPPEAIGGLPPPSSTIYPVTPPQQYYLPPQPVPEAVPNWADQNRGGWDPWGPKQPNKELTEIRQSIESLRSEIADLKETIKTLETQIQLLNRNILLSEKARDNSGKVSAE